ncbi:phage tail sheath family protein [Enterobacteriaceae bacterium LUAb1]
MAIVNPGVSFSETLLPSVPNHDAVTMPLFIAHTVCPTNVKTLQPVSVTSLTEAVALFGVHGTLAYSLRHFFENGGLSCYVLPLIPLELQAQKSPLCRIQSLITTLQSAELQEVISSYAIGLLLAPEMSELNDITETDVAPLWYQGWQALLQLCNHKQQRFSLLEMPENPQHAHLLITQSFPADLSQNGAAWWPRLQTSYEDISSGQTTRVVLSPLPAVAAVIQCNACIKGIWKAPANILLEKTLRLTKTVFQAQTLLNRQGVYCNLIRSFAGKGIRLWGCRTLLNDEDSPWRYIQIRLLVNRVESQIRKLARVFLFEPNTMQTWMKLKGQIWTWLRQQWLAGAFFGTTEEEAFTLDVGLGETMNDDDIRAGKMILLVRLALLAPAEFVDVSLTLDMHDGPEIRQNRN